MTAVERVWGGPQGVVRPGAIHEGMSWRCNPLSSPPARGRDQNAMTMRQCPPPRCALRGAWIHDRHDPDRASPRRAAPPKSRASPATDRWLAAPDARRRRPHGLRRDRRRRPGRGDHPRRHVGRPPSTDRARQARLRRSPRSSTTAPGEVELGRFQEERRRVVTFEDDPEARPRRDDHGRGPHVLEQRGLRLPRDPRGGRRERLGRRATAAPRRSPSSSSAHACCPRTSSQAGADRYVRKVKEIIQALRVTEAFPGEEGKERIITAYLNEIFYGHGAYGIAAAARDLFRRRRSRRS